MVLELKMPALSPTMEEGKIISWNKKEGDKLSVGDVILEVETDKAIMEVESQEKGTLGKILIEADNVAKVGSTIAIILEKNESIEDLKNYKTENTQNPQIDSFNKVDNNITEEINKEQNISQTITNNNENNKIFASPLAKNIAKLNNIDINLIQGGSGPNGRIIKEDIEKFLSNNHNKNFIGRNSVEYTDIEPNNMRNAIAKRLTESKQQIPHWYLKVSVDMSSSEDLRKQLNNRANIVNDKAEYKISVNDMIVMAVSRALKKYKQINAIWFNNKIRQYNNVDVAVACSVENGILTPVVKNSDQMSIIDLSKSIKNIVKNAREGKISNGDSNNCAITISNLGMYDVEEFTSIINPPQSCIIAVGAIKNEVVAVDNASVAVKPICNITFSADHRVIDGAVLAPFAKEVKTLLENPALMFV